MMLAFQEVAFAELEAEHFPEVCLTYNVISVPTVLLFRRGEFLDRVDGVKVAELTNKVKTHVSGENSFVNHDINVVVGIGYKFWANAG